MLTPTAVSADAGRFELQVPVLYYHRILCPPPDATIPSLYECPEQFQAQLSYLHDQGWESITADEVADLVADRQCPPAKRFVISLDDGAKDGYTNAAPIMESLGMHGTYFVTSGVSGSARTGSISWEELRDLVSRGHAIGNHSKTHLSLNKQTEATLYDQIEGAQQIFAAQLGFRPRTFAYPYGRYNDLVIAQVAASGFDLAFTVRRGAREASDAPFVSKRLRVAPTDSGADLLEQLIPYSEGCRPPTPDLSAALASAGPYTGNHIYASTATKAQTVKRTGVNVGRTYRYWVRLDNDAQIPGSIRLTATVDGTATMDVRYEINGVDVTGSITGAGYASPVIEPWSSTTIVVYVTPRKPRVIGAVKRIVIRAVSPDSGMVDVVRLVARF